MLLPAAATAATAAAAAAAQAALQLRQRVYPRSLLLPPPP
jgi:hypothetical protein